MAASVAEVSRYANLIFTPLLVLILILMAFFWPSMGGGEDSSMRGHHQRMPQRRSPVGTVGVVGDCDPNEAPSFWGMGITVSTDKVTLPESHIRQSHTYQFAYEHWLRPIRCQPLKFLEIGLGCGMPYMGMNGGYASVTEGHSVPLWLSFMPHANITVIEYDGKCAANFMANDPLKVGVELQKRVRMFAGDQSKPEDLLKVMRDPSVGMQDVIIDDGGHSMKQQLTTLRTLLPWVKPGGILIMEDLQSTYSWQDPNWHDNGKQATMMDCKCLSVANGRSCLFTYFPSPQTPLLSLSNAYRYL